MMRQYVKPQMNPQMSIGLSYSNLNLSIELRIKCAILSTERVHYIQYRDVYLSFFYM